MIKNQQINTKNTNKHPKWLNDYLNSYKQRTGGEINSIEEIEFKNNHDILWLDLLPDIQKAMNKEVIMRFSLKPLRKPKFISFYRIGSMNYENDMQVGIEVSEYTEKEIKTIPFSGFVVMGDCLITAEETDDSTAELMIKLLEIIFENNLKTKK
jgi:hypothetical protein